MTRQVVIHKKVSKKVSGLPLKIRDILNALIAEIKCYWAYPGQSAELWETGDSIHHSNTGTETNMYRKMAFLYI